MYMSFCILYSVEYVVSFMCMSFRAHPFQQRYEKVYKGYSYASGT